MALHHRRCRPGFCVAWCALAGEERRTQHEQAIRADERAKVTAEIVAWLRHCAACGGDDETNAVERHIARAIERGEHRPKPGQPKEG